TTTHAAATPRLWWPRPNLCAGIRRAMFYRRRQWWGSTCPGADRSFLAPGGDLESGGAVVLQVDARVAAFDQGVLDLSQRTLQRGDDRFPIPGSKSRSSMTSCTWLESMSLKVGSSAAVMMSALARGPGASSVSKNKSQAASSETRNGDRDVVAARFSFRPGSSLEDPPQAVSSSPAAATTIVHLICRPLPGPSPPTNRSCADSELFPPQTPRADDMTADAVPVRDNRRARLRTPPPGRSAGDSSQGARHAIRDDPSRWNADRREPPL